MQRRVLVGIALVALVGGAGMAFGQGSPAEWLKRIFDPTTLGLQVFPGAMLNRKLSTDAIGLQRGGNRRIAIYIIELDQVKAAADNFQQQVGVAPQVTGTGTQFLTYTFDFSAPGKGPEKLNGLIVQIGRSPFIDGKGQIRMDYEPPKAS
jgi:hypothetical protein